MAITFPREFLEIDSRLPLRTMRFAPVYAQTRAVTRGARPQVANLASDLWQGVFTTHVLQYEDALEYEAWLQSLDGGTRLFKMWHTLRPYPREYPYGFDGMVASGGSPEFDGQCNLYSIGENLDTITLDALPNSFKFSIGDMLSFPIGEDSRALLRVMEAVTSNGSGIVTLSVRPLVPLSATEDVEVELVKPWCLASVDASSISTQYDADTMTAVVQFTATQVY
jgi:hypothetical protein